MRVSKRMFRNKNKTNERINLKRKINIEMAPIKLLKVVKL